MEGKTALEELATDAQFFGELYTLILYVRSVVGGDRLCAAFLLTPTPDADEMSWLEYIVRTPLDIRRVREAQGNLEKMLG